MLKKYFLLSLLITATIAQSQEIVNATPIGLKKAKSVFQVVNDTKKETTIFVSDKEKVKAIRLDKEMKIIDSLSTTRLDPSTYSSMIGYNEKNSNINLFWTSADHKELFIQQFNFDKLKGENKTFTSPLKDEKFIQTFSQNEKFYILTILKNSDKFKLYVFDNNGNLEEKIIDLTGLKFYKSDYQKTTLYGMFNQSFYGSEPPFSLQKIRPENPTSLVESSKKRKCYSNDKNIILTMDDNIDYTQLITLNLESFTAKEQFIKKPTFNEDRTFLHSNSFLIDNKLYQIKSSSSKLMMTIKDLDDNLIKSYEATDTNPIIDFKNSNIIQENGGISNKRILETSNQFIRKTNNSNSGISCYKLNDNYLVTLGSVSQQQQNNTGAIVGGMFGVAGVLAGALIDAAVSNPTMESFDSYANRKVVYINGLFDQEGKHIEGEINPIAFDKIRLFLDKKSDFSSQTLYKMDQSYYFGYYDNSNKQYTIRLFQD